MSNSHATNKGVSHSKTVRSDVSSSSGNKDELRSLHADYLAERERIRASRVAERAHAAWNTLNGHIEVIAIRDNGTIYSYDEGIWRPDGEQALREAAAEIMESDYSASVLGELKELVRAKNAITREKLGVDNNQVAVANGLLNLDDRTLRDLQTNDYALTQIPVEYDPDAEVTQWKELVEEWAENDRADALQEYVGYCLHVGQMPIHRALLLVGSGANGKSTFLSVVRSLLGHDNITSVGPQTLANDEKAVSDFYGSLANIDEDLSTQKLGSGLGMFKKLTAGDPIRARPIYEDGFEFTPTGKHLYAANEVPDVDVPDDDEAFWRRWLLVEFPNHYPTEERDPDLCDRLTDPDVLSGVLNWALDGRDRLLDQGYFTNELRRGAAKRERWQAWGDSVDRFINTLVERDPDADNKSTSEVYDRYVDWCQENDEDPVGQQKFTNSLKTESVDYKSSIRVNGKVTRGYKSLSINDQGSGSRG